MANATLPLFHPGEILREEYLVPLGMSAGALARKLHVPRTRIERLIKQTQPVTVDTALRLAKFFDTTPHYWLNMQVAYDLGLEGAALAELASRSRGTPRIANRLLRRVRDWLLVHAGSSDIDGVRAALELYDVDEAGLDRIDRAVLHAIAHRFGGGPVGLSTLAAAVGEEADTIESVVEPFLVREGLIGRTPRGRIATASGMRHARALAPDDTLDGV